MASFEELLNAAAKADAAGDTAAAKALVESAMRVRGEVATSQVDAATGEQMAMRPPRADTPVEENMRPDRFGDTFSGAVAGPWEATKAFGRGLTDMDQSSSPTLAALPDWLPMRRGIARTGDAAMTALGALSTGYAAGAGLAGEMFGGSPTNEAKLTRDLMMMGEVAVPELAGVSSTMRAASSVPGKVRPPNPASELGITPSLGMSGKPGAIIAATLEKPVFTASAIANDAARAAGEIEAVLQKNVYRIGTPGNAETAGAALQRGLTDYVERFQANAAKMFNKVDSYIPSDTRVSLDRTVNAFDDAMRIFEGNPELASKLGVDSWRKVIEEARNGGISWGALKTFRTNVGKAVGKMTGALTDQDEARLKGLYATLTDDMAAAAEAAGPDALKAWENANKFYAKGATRIEKQLDSTISAKTPERAFSAFMNATRDGASSSDIMRIRSIRASMPKEEWGQVVSTIVDRLGKPPAGQQNAAGDVFSPGVFLTNWNKMSPDARNVLLSPDVRQELNKLAKVVETFKDASKERNLSNTGTVAANAALLYALFDAPMTGGAVAGTGLITSKALTSGPFLRALNGAVNGDIRPMQALARGKTPFSDDAREVMRLLAAQNANEPANSNAPLRGVMP